MPLVWNTRSNCRTWIKHHTVNLLVTVSISGPEEPEVETEAELVAQKELTCIFTPLALFFLFPFTTSSSPSHHQAQPNTEFQNCLQRPWFQKMNADRYLVFKLKQKTDQWLTFLPAIPSGPTLSSNWRMQASWTPVMSMFSAGKRKTMTRSRPEADTYVFLLTLFWQDLKY